MFSKQTLSKIFFFFTIVLFILPKFIRAEEDDDDLLGEIIVDLMVGVAVSACETNAMCSAFMTIMTIAIIIISLIGCCINGCRCDDEYRPSRKSLRRVGTGAIGYGIGRSLFH